MSTTNDNNQDDQNEVDIEHLLLIEEEDIDISALPSAIRNAMRKFNAKLKEYEETGDSDLYLELMQDDVAIADDITTWLEDTESDDDDDDEDDSYLNDDDSETDTKSTTNRSVSELEQKVRAALSNGLISVNSLQEIIPIIKSPIFNICIRFNFL